MKIFLIALLLIPGVASAHAFGFSHETTVNGYFVDIGYSTAAPTPSEAVIFDFNLPAQHADVPYSDVWVRITNEAEAVVFASGIHNASFGGPRMSYVFPRAGTYTIHTRYENGTDVLLETSFDITVVPEEEDIPTDLVLLVVAAVGVGGVGLYVGRRLGSRK